MYYDNEGTLAVCGCGVEAAPCPAPEPVCRTEVLPEHRRLRPTRYMPTRRAPEWARP